MTDKRTPAGADSGVIDFVTRRIRFCKVGSMQYISHLDLQRTLARVMVRAHIPLWFSKGFNPHPKLVFAMPLSVGSESVCELLDIRLCAPMDGGEMREALNRQLTRELWVDEVYEPTTKFSDISAAVYHCTLETAGADEAMARKITDTLTGGSLLMTKRTKSGDKEMDIIPQIIRADAVWQPEQGEISLDMTLSATSDNFLNPELVISALKAHTGILSSDPLTEKYTIMRQQILDGQGRVFR